MRIEIIDHVRKYCARSENEFSQVEVYVNSPSLLSSSISDLEKSNDEYKKYLSSVYVVEVPATAREMQLKAQYVAVRLRLEANTELLEVLNKLKLLYENKVNLKTVLAPVGASVD